MDLTLTDEQKLIGEAANSFIADQYTFEGRRAIVASDDGFSRKIWADFASLGWLGLAIPEDFGGSGADAVTIGILMEALGRGLVVEPFLATAVVAAKLIDGLGPKDQRKALLDPIAEGKSIIAFAHVEDANVPLPRAIETTARFDGDHWRISGQKCMVFAAPWADTLLVTARVSNDPHDRPSIRVFVVSANASGVRIAPYLLLDGARAANIAFENVPAMLLGRNESAAGVIEAISDLAIAAVCFEAIGCMQVLLDDTIAYTKTRIQFGKPLADNQVLRHRMASMAVQLEEARASSLRAALMATDAPERRARAASGAKLKVGRAGRFISEQAVQLHGAMGVTDELNVGAYFKRLMTIEAMFGSPDMHLRNHARAWQSTERTL